MKGVEEGCFLGAGRWAELALFHRGKSVQNEDWKHEV